MSLDYNGGSFFIGSNDGQWIPIGDGVSRVLEYCSDITEEVDQFLFNKTKDCSFTCELNECDLSMLDWPDGYNVSQSFVLEYEKSIMIQSRWHKKARVRKKWLHRYGMKLDTVKVKSDATNLGYDPNDGRMSFEMEYIYYLWKPHQKRKGLKILYLENEGD